MAAKDLTSAEKEQLAEIVGQIKETKAYKNYQAGLSVNKRRLESSPGEGDAFAKAGEMIRSGKIPTWLHASAVGQTKVEKALQALLKEKKLHGLLKDGEFKEALYDELYVESGALNRFLINDGREAAAEAGQELADNPGPADDHTAAADSNTKPQEEKMSEEKKQAEVKDNVPVDGAAADNGNDQMVDLPDYYDEEKFKDLEIKIVNGKISKADNEKLEKRKKELEKGGNNDQQDSPKKGESKDGAAAAPDNKAKEGDESEKAANTMTVDQEANDAKTKQPPVDEPWVVKYNEALTKWGKEHDNEWTRDNEPNEAGEYPVGLKGNFKDGTELHYTAKDKVSVKAPEGQEITADHFAAVIALAKENDQDLKLGATMSPAFKKALLEAAARDGVTIQGLSAEDQQLYDSFKPKEPEQKEPEQNQEPQPEQKKPEQKVEVQRKEVKDTDEHGDSLYKVSPTVVEGWMTMYRAKAASKLLDPMIANHEKLLAAGAYEVTGGEKARAQLLAMKYVQAMSKGDKEQADLCVTAMQRYGIDTVSRQSKTKDNNGRDTVTAKPYAERTDEEKAKINEAAEKMLPKKAQTYDPSVMRALAERQGQTLQ